MRAVGSLIFCDEYVDKEGFGYHLTPDGMHLLQDHFDDTYSKSLETNRYAFYHDDADGFVAFNKADDGSVKSVASNNYFAEHLCMEVLEEIWIGKGEDALVWMDENTHECLPLIAAESEWEEPAEGGYGHAYGSYADAPFNQPTALPTESTVTPLAEPTHAASPERVTGNTIHALYAETTRNLSRDPDAWTAFLGAAGRNYKLPFDEQVLIFAQRPDATAVLELSRWNEQFDRWVNKGARGIAVFGAPGTRSLRHYFDVSDTHAGRHPREVPFWQMKRAYEPAVIDTLRTAFDASADGNLSDALQNTANVLAADNMEDYLSDLKLALDGSALANTDEHELAQCFSRMVSASVACELGSRLGASISAECKTVFAQNLHLFSSTETMNALGCAVSDISEIGLREVAACVLGLQREPDPSNRRLADGIARTDNPTKSTEPKRSDHGNHLREGRRDQPAEPDNERIEGSDTGDVRKAAPDLSQSEPKSAVHEPSFDRQPERPSGRNREPSTHDGASDPRRNDEARGRGREPEKDGSDALGADDEQSSAKRTRDRAPGADLQLKALPEQGVQRDETKEASGKPPVSLVSGTAALPRKPKTAQTPLGQTMFNLSENFTITDDKLGEGNHLSRLHGNMNALRVLREIEAEGRYATPDEQEALSRYTGWGSLAKVFDDDDTSWALEKATVRARLTESEYEAARASTLNAHFTSPVVIKAIYEALSNMGFARGNILEPACGTGNFFGLMPDKMRDSSLFGVELDPTTARIAQLLYPKADIRQSGFEETSFPQNFFDVAVGNVPFGSYGVADKRYDKHHFLIHDYFFAHALDLVRPGGIVAFITSKGTLDKKNPSVRRYIAERAELVGAIRLPNTAFEANAGTRATADIVFLQKRDRPVVCEPDWVHLGLTEGDIAVNSYFAEHPEMVLGTMSRENAMYYGRGDETTCAPFEGEDLGELLRGAVSGIHAHVTDYERDEPDADEVFLAADPSVKNYSYTLVNGEVYFRIDSKMYPAELSKTGESRVKGMVGIRDTLRELIDQQTNDAADSEIEQTQEVLGRQYDDYTKKYGILNSRANSTAFNQDSAYALLCALEDLDDEGNLIGKADMFHKRTIRPYATPQRVGTSTEALAASLAEKACVDVGFMAGLTGKSEQEIVDELTGVIFRDPESGNHLAADEYLSGNVRAKLAVARARAGGDESYRVNVEALEKVVPEDIDASEISVRLGATWVPADDVQAFMHELLETPRWRQPDIQVRYSPITAQWNITGKSKDSANVLACATFGTPRASAYRIIEDTLNLRDTRIFDYVVNAEGKREAILNKKATAIALSKQDAIKEAFKDWIFSDPERRERLVRTYNDTFNSMRMRTFDGSHLTFPGMNPEVKLRRHQVDAVARILYAGNTLLAHEVGAGKTYVVAAATQELKRIGLANKSLIVVPNHLTEQWAAEYLKLYPAANLLVASKRDFERNNRRRFCARIATGNYDAVIIGHTQFEKIPMSIERQRDMLHREINELIDGIAELKEQRGERFSIKQLESSRKRLEVRLKKLNDQTSKDDVIEFEQLGIDRLFVDESHYYKNLFFYTKMRNVGGIPQTEAMKSSDLFAKCRYLDELTGGKGIVFATGTPISNSMVELYTVQRYLQYGELSRLNLHHFDCWASTFGETVTAIELAPEGTGYRQKTRFAKFYNLPELMTLFRQVADIQAADMLALPVPKVNYHNVSLPASEFQSDLVLDLSDRADRVRNRMVDATVDNMLLITNDGRKLALDQRLYDDELPDNPNGKTAICAENVYRIWKEHERERSTQLVFCDLSTPTGDKAFSVYHDLKAKLMTHGVPEEEIAFIHDYNTEARKAELFGKVRSGQVRVLLGSTQKMGAGTNVQTRLIALHDLDCPWRPSDLQQRLGRIERQGNRNPEVEVFRYVTENTFDAYLYQLVENKQRFIGQVMTSKSPVRAAADVDETALSYAELKALATGNPLFKEHMDLEVDVSRLRLLKSDHLAQKYAHEDRLAQVYPQKIAALTERIAGHAADAATAKANPPAEKESFSMAVDGVGYTDKTEAGRAVLAFAKTMTSPEAVPLGHYRGFPLEVAYDTLSRNFTAVIVGKLRHPAALGADEAGCITRIDNAIERIEGELEAAKQALSDTEKQVENAKAEVAKPFDKEDELKEKSARLSKIKKELDMDKSDETQLCEDASRDTVKRKQLAMER